METLEKQIGTRLRMRREELNLSQAFVAGKMKVAVTTVQRLESGEVQPRIDTLLAFCQAVGFSLEEAVGAARIENHVRFPSNTEILDVVKNALKVAENPLIKRLLDCSEEERDEISKRLDMIEHRRQLAAESAKPAKVAKKRE